MTDPRDLLDKADALLSRYRDTGLADVPVLTEIVELAPAYPPAPPQEPGEPQLEGTPSSELPPVEVQPLEVPPLEVQPPEVQPAEVHAPETQPHWQDALRPELDALEQRLHGRIDGLMAEFRARLGEAVEDEVRAFRAELLRSPDTHR